MQIGLINIKGTYNIEERIMGDNKIKQLTISIRCGFLNKQDKFTHNTDIIQVPNKIKFKR